ncbi:hypothetical protein HPB47_014359, partial [Ixodes persulcatus]
CLMRSRLTRRTKVTTSGTEKMIFTAYQWRDSKNVLLMSNYHDPDEQVEEMVEPRLLFILDAAIVNAFVQHNSRESSLYLQFRVLLGFRKSRRSHVLRERGKKNGCTMTGVPKELRYEGTDHHPHITETRERC